MQPLSHLTGLPPGSSEHCRMSHVVRPWSVVQKAEILARWCLCRQITERAPAPLPMLWNQPQRHSRDGQNRKYCREKS